MGLSNISDLVAAALTPLPLSIPKVIGRAAVASAQGIEHIKALVLSGPNTSEPRLWGRWKWELIVDLELSVHAWMLRPEWLLQLHFRARQVRKERLFLRASNRCVFIIIWQLSYSLQLKKLCIALQRHGTWMKQWAPFYKMLTFHWIAGKSQTKCINGFNHRIHICRLYFLYFLISLSWKNTLLQERSVFKVKAVNEKICIKSVCHLFAVSFLHTFSSKKFSRGEKKGWGCVKKYSFSSIHRESATKKPPKQSHNFPLFTHVKITS